MYPVKRDAIVLSLISLQLIWSPQHAGDRGTVPDGSVLWRWVPSETSMPGVAVPVMKDGGFLKG